MNFYGNQEKSFVSEIKPSFFIADTTLRDGEQSPGIVFTPEQKIKIAKKLDDIGIECIDAGFPAISSDERKSIKGICEQGLNLRVMTMCRPNRKEIDMACECGVNGVILWIPTSDIHIRAKFGDDLKMHRKMLVQMSKEAIDYAKNKDLIIEFGIEDGARTEINFQLDVFNMAQEAGAEYLGTTDTVGYMTPEKMYSYIKELCDHLDLPIGVHCHNDFGLATVNTIAGLLAGGSYCSPTVNGIGERAGNASLEELIMIMKIHYDLDLKYKTEHIYELSKMIEEFSGFKMDAFKPIVGSNAYVHESGIHTHGMLKDPLTYEILDPKSIGTTRKYMIGKHSGKHIAKHFLDLHGIDASEKTVNKFWYDMKSVNKIGNNICEEELISLYQHYASNKQM